MNKLYIDTTSNKEIIVRLTVDEKVFEEKREIENNRTQIVLPLVEKLLHENNLKPQDLEKIEVNPGPGSFTGVRVGVSISNALIFGLKIDASLVKPLY